VDDVEQAIRARLSCPESFEPYHSAKLRQHPYYRISVKNYTIFYVVLDDTMEVRRILYSRRNLSKYI
jgi:plasmid stabilization system protein ParE